MMRLAPIDAEAQPAADRGSRQTAETVAIC